MKKVGPNKNRKFSIEWKDNISKAMKGKNTGPKSEDTKQKMKKPKSNTEKMGKYIRSEKTKQKLSESLKGENNPRGMSGKNHRIDSKQLMSSKAIDRYSKVDGYWLNKKIPDEAREKMSRSRKLLFKDQDFLRNFKERIKSTRIEIPNKQEIIIETLLDFLFPGKYNFVGDFSIWIDGRNPDFINEEEKRIVEFFGKNWHKEEDEVVRKNHFEKNGYKTLVIWDYELKDLNKLKSKIENF